MFASPFLTFFLHFSFLCNLFHSSIFYKNFLSNRLPFLSVRDILKQRTERKSCLMSFFHWFGYGVIVLCLLLGLSSCEEEKPSSSPQSSVGDAYVEVTPSESKQESTKKDLSEATQLLFHKALKATRLVYASDKDKLSSSGATVTNTAQVRQNQRLNLTWVAEANLSRGFPTCSMTSRKKRGRPFPLPPTSAFGMWLYVEEPQALQSLTLPFPW